MTNGWKIDPKRDLVLERVVDVPVELVWKAWTEPKHLMPWFCPKPWSVTDCEIDLRPGGIFRVTMRSPEGQEYPNDGGCYLEVTPHKRLIWTSALLPGYRPQQEVKDDTPFTAVIDLAAESNGTRYTAIAIHRDESGREAHEKMGFHQGWSASLDQLVAYVKTL